MKQHLRHKGSQDEDQGNILKMAEEKEARNGDFNDIVEPLN